MTHLVLTVEGLEGAGADVFVERRAGQVVAAELAACDALGARVLEVVLHEHARYLCATRIGARYRVVLACVQVCLEHDITKLVMKTNRVES